MVIVTVKINYKLISIIEQADDLFFLPVLKNSGHKISAAQNSRHSCIM